MKLIKRCTNALLALAALAALASCYFPGNQTGRMELAFAPSKQTHSEQIVVRVYLLADGLLFSTDSRTPFSAEVPVGSAASEVRVSIEGLPVGPRYRALVGYGMVEPWGMFDVWQFGESEEFTVSPGASTSVPVALQEKPYAVSFSSELTGKNLKGVAFSMEMSTLYAAEEQTLYQVDPFLSVAGSYPLSGALASQRINSLSEDRGWISNYDLLMNTDKGIVPFSGPGTGWDFDSEFSAGLTASVLESGTMWGPSEERIVFFRRANGLGGRILGGPDGPQPWVSRDVTGVLDMVLSERNAYFATTSGAFALPPEFLSDGDLSLRVPFSAPSPILSLGFISYEGSTLFLGTTDGLWEAALDEAVSVTISEPEFQSQILGTAGRRIEMIAVYGTNRLAFLSRYWLFLYKDAVLYRIPFFAVIPGRATGMAWSSNGWNLYVSGTEGLSAIYVGC